MAGQGPLTPEHLDIAACFNRCFRLAENTEMLGGADEPLYRPGFDGLPAQLFYRQDFAASALHEAAHWCIAGCRRRTQIDFGYAYLAPPRDANVQDQFFASELKAQALERIFATAVGLDFQPSADNLDASLVDFSTRLDQTTPEVQHWLENSVDTRARVFCTALAELKCGSRIPCLAGPNAGG